MTARKRFRKEEAFWWLNMVLPLLLGFSVYLFLNSDHMLGFVIERLFGPGRESRISEQFFTGLCMYGRDFFWGYALIFALSYRFRGNLSELRLAFTVAGAFEILMELWRIATAMGGRFDLMHVFIVLAGNVIAILTILVEKRAVV